MTAYQIDIEKVSKLHARKRRDFDERLQAVREIEEPFEVAARSRLPERLQLLFQVDELSPSNSAGPTP